VAHDLQQAAYLLLSAYQHFPKGTVHIAMVEVFNGDTPRMLLAAKDGHFFIAPDNGILPLAFGAGLENTRLCFEFSKPYVFNDWVHNAGLVVKALQDDTALSLFPPCDAKDAQWLLQSIVIRDGIECTVLYIDRYENVILNITRSQFEALVQDRPFRIMLRKGDITTISNYYHDVPEGEILCRFNDSGFMEIALNRAGAASLLNLGPNNTHNLRYKTIRILF
jgi:S-adenosylmethionine hydrolase